MELVLAPKIHSSTTVCFWLPHSIENKKNSWKWILESACELLLLVNNLKIVVQLAYNMINDF